MMLKEFYSLEAEQSVLGSLMSDDNTDCLVIAELKHTDFFIEKHKYIFRAIQILHEKDINPDQISVLTWLTDNGHIDLVGIESFMSINTSYTGNGNFKYHHQIVKDHSRRRHLQKTLARMQEKLLEAGEMDEIETIISKGTDLLTQTTTSNATTFIHIEEITYDVIENMQKETKGLTGLTTGFTEFDKMTSGLQDGQFVVIGARPSMGKTAFALNITTGAAKAGALVPVYSLEMSNNSLGIRMLSANSNVESRRIKEGGQSVTPDDWSKIGAGGGELAGLDIMVSDKSFVTVYDIKRDLMRLRKLHPGRKIMCIIDYLQLVNGSQKYAGNRQQEVSEISRILKTTAKDNDIIIVALSQLSRGVEQRQDKRPMMSDLRESGSIEQDADIIGFLYREEYYDRESPQKNIIELIIAKNREGQVGSVELAFIKEYGKMVNLERRFDN